MPRSVWALGFVSLLMDTSSEMIHSLLPVFLVGSLGASVALVGVIEGVGEATSSITKIFSGWLSDRLGKRKLLAVAGYGLAALTKPVFPFAVTPFEVLAARFVDRVGKGVRGAPRDALVADITPPEIRGAAFGLRQSLDTIGAVAGPLAAIGLMMLLAGHIRAVFAWAVVPAVAAVVLLAAGVEEPKHVASATRRTAPIRWSEVKDMGWPFWSVVVIGVVFALARFSEAFLVLRARDVGMEAVFVPVVMVVMNLVYAVTSAPAGSLSDRVDRRIPLVGGLAALVLADAALAGIPNLWGLFLGVGLWGLHMGLTQGALSALVADMAPEQLRGTAFGLFNLASGVAMLGASVLAGVLWTAYGAPATFMAGGLFAAITAAGLLLRLRNARRSA